MLWVFQLTKMPHLDRSPLLLWQCWQPLRRFQYTLPETDRFPRASSLELISLTREPLGEGFPVRICLGSSRRYHTGQSSIRLLVRSTLHSPVPSITLRVCCFYIVCNALYKNTRFESRQKLQVLGLLFL